MDEFFTPEEGAAWGGYLRTHGRLSKLVEEHLRQTAGVSHAEYEVLLRLCLADDGRLRIQAIAERSVLTHSGTSRLVDRLERAGFVERSRAEEDGRGADVAITAAGRAHFETTARAHHRHVREIFLRHYTPEELRTMAALWARLDAR